MDENFVNSSIATTVLENLTIGLKLVAGRIL